MDGLDMGYQGSESIRYVLSLEPSAVRQLTFFQSILAPNLIRFFNVVSALPDLLEQESIERSSFVKSVNDESPADVSSVLETLGHFGIVVPAYYSEFVEFSDEWKSREALQALVCQISKFVLWMKVIVSFVKLSFYLSICQTFLTLNFHVCLYYNFLCCVL